MSYHVGAQRAINSVFTTFGVQGEYTPQGGTPLNVTVIKRQPDEVIDVLDTPVHSATNQFVLRHCEVVAPKAGDTLVIGATTYTVQGTPVQDQHRMYWHFEAPAQSFDPTSLASLVCWLDGADITTVDNNNGLISRWHDKSGNEVDFFQSTLANMPSLTVENDSRLAVNMATNKTLQTSTLARYDVGTFFMVVKPGTPWSATMPASEQLLREMNTAMSSFVVGPFTGHLTNEVIGVRGAAGDNDRSGWEDAAAVVPNTDYVLLAFRFTGMDYEIFLNSLTNRTNDTYTDHGIWEVNNNPLIIGAAATFRLREVLWYETPLPQAELISVFDYLNEKWRLGL